MRPHGVVEQDLPTRLDHAAVDDPEVGRAPWSAFVSGNYHLQELIRSAVRHFEADRSREG